MKILCLLPIAAIIFVLQACDNKPPEDKVTDVNKDGGIETHISVQHIDSLHDLLITTHKVWVKNSVYKTFTTCDTIPFLGMTMAQGEDANGNTQNVSVKKDYEIYITVK